MISFEELDAVLDKHITAGPIIQKLTDEELCVQNGNGDTILHDPAKCSIRYHLLRQYEKDHLLDRLLCTKNQAGLNCYDLCVLDSRWTFFIGPLIVKKMSRPGDLSMLGPGSQEILGQRLKDRYLKGLDTWRVALRGSMEPDLFSILHIFPDYINLRHSNGLTLFVYAIRDRAQLISQILGVPSFHMHYHLDAFYNRNRGRLFIPEATGLEVFLLLAHPFLPKGAHRDLIASTPPNFLGDITRDLALLSKPGSDDEPEVVKKARINRQNALEQASVEAARMFALIIFHSDGLLVTKTVQPRRPFSYLSHFLEGGS